MTTRAPRGTAGSTSVLPMLAAITAAVVLVVVAFVGIGALADAGSETDAPTAGDVRVEQVSAEAFESVPLQTPKEEVLAALRPAEPVDLRVLDRYEQRSPETASASCVYFDSEGVRVGALYRFCFREDVLVDKTVVLPKDDA